MSLITPEVRASAEILTENEVCKEKIKTLLKEYCLPDGLLPVENVEEFGYVKETGFTWIKQKCEIKHKYEKISKQVSFANEITFYFENCKMKKLTGVKAKELLIWIPCNEIHTESQTSDKVTFKTPTGLSKTFPKDAFVA
ncbi:hypothetical protein QVD17_22947 [Tagetes erecta]|uniref:Uncharacterized protein n=1 Tax=Tagetes erecta TaxID=13708 RepID=A0AAD8KE10_TARER|nr:hypothetical protein QVD17_22947 [Tagetes erecta]